MTRLQSLVLLTLAVCTVGCTKNYTILPQAYSRSDSEATEGAVHPYLGDQGRPEQGPFVVVFVATTTDLKKASETWTHHLYYNLFPCSPDEDEELLFSGDVFEANTNERTAVFGPASRPETNLYKVYIPLDSREVARRARTIGGLTIEDELCLKIGGAQAWGAAMFSDMVEIPIAVVDGALVIESGLKEI